MPWGWAADQGIVKKWADKYGISIEVVQINDYVELINQYTAGGFDGCVMTNMDALTIPAVGGTDSTALIVGDFSNGNDGIVSKTAKSLAELKGQKINLVELSVSHYLLARALEKEGLAERDLGGVVNTSDADIVSVFTSAPDVEHVVTWNPLLAEVLAVPGTTKLFDSSQIPGEIIDLMVVNTEALSDNPGFGKALVGAWYETMAIMAGSDDAAKAARTAMAEASATDLAGYDAQLAATRMFVHAGRRRGLHHQPRARRHHGQRAQILRCARAAAGRARCGRDRVPRRQDAGRRRQRQAALHRGVHEARRRPAPSEARMRRIVNFRPQPGTGLLLAALPFVLLVAAYLIGSQARLAVNPNDKLLPAFSSIATALRDMALIPDQRSGDYLFWTDTAASLVRLGDRHRPGGPSRPGARDCDRPRSGGGRHALRLRRDDLDDPAARRTAHPVHRLRPGRALQGRADHDRHRPLSSCATSPFGSASCRRSCW